MTTTYFSGETPMVNDRVHWVDDPDLHLTVTELLGDCVSVKFQSGVVGRYLASRFNLLQREVAKPEQPPFAPKQFVRIKSSGTILNVARCEKRVVHGALRWVVDDLNGERAFADECELYEGVKPEVRYACTKLAAVGDTVKYVGVKQSVVVKVTKVHDDGICYYDFTNGCRGHSPASALEFVPEAGFPLFIDFIVGPNAVNRVEVVRKDDHDRVVADRDAIISQLRAELERFKQPQYSEVFMHDELRWISTARAIVERLMMEFGADNTDFRERDRLIGIVSPYLDKQQHAMYALRQRAEQAEAKCEELEKRLNAEDVAHGNTIDHRDTHEASINAICAALGMEEYDASWTSHNNPPERAIEYIEALQSEAEQLTIAKLLLGQCDNRMFLVGKLELRRKQSGWSVFDPVANMFDDERFADPIAAYQRAKTLLEAFGKEAGAT